MVPEPEGTVDDPETSPEKAVNDQSTAEQTDGAHDDPAAPDSDDPADGERTPGELDRIESPTSGEERPETDERPTVLVPVAVLKGESIADGVPELLGNAHVILLGYHVIPDQTAPGNARMQFEDRAMAKLAAFQEHFEREGATVERRLAFTHERQQTFDRVIRETDSQAAIVLNPIETVESVLVPIRGAVGLDRVVRVVGGLLADSDVSVTLYHLLDEDETMGDVETMLEGVRDRLGARGLGVERIETLVEDVADPVDAIVAAAAEHDVVIMGETDPSVVTYLFGMPSDQIAERFLGPVLVVQRERPAKGTEKPETEPQAEEPVATDGDDETGVPDVDRIN